MPAIINSDDGVVSGSAGLKTSGANDGITAFQQNGTESVRITAAGNVGIGTSSPAYKLDVQAATAVAQVKSTTGTNAAYYVSNNTGGDFYIGRENSAGTTFGTAAYSAVLWSAGAYPMSFFTNGIERMRLDSSGNLGIGTTSPVGKVESKTATVAGGSADYAQKAFVANITYSTTNVISSLLSGWDSSSIHGVDVGYTYNGTGYNLIFSTNDNTSGNPIERARITSGGDYVVGSASTVSSAGRFQAVQASSTANACISADAQSSSYAYNIAYLNTNTAAGTGFYFITCTSGGYAANQFRVRGDGTIYAQNTTVQSLSDVRVKENIRDSDEGLQVILGLKPRRFDFKQGFGNDRKNVLGFIAQEIETVFPEAVDITTVDPDNDGPEEPYKSVGPSALIPVLVKAIQELKAELDATKAEVAALKARTT